MLWERPDCIGQEESDWTLLTYDAIFMANVICFCNKDCHQTAFWLAHMDLSRLQLIVILQPMNYYWVLSISATFGQWWGGQGGYTHILEGGRELLCNWPQFLIFSDPIWVPIFYDSTQSYRPSFSDPHPLGASHNVAYNLFWTFAFMCGACNSSKTGPGVQIES